MVIDPLIVRLIGALVGLMVVLALRRLIQHRLVGQIADIDTRYRARKAVSIAAWAFIAFILVAIFSDRLGSFTVAFGVAGAGIAFALQEVIVSVAGWIAIVFGKVFRIGDRVKIGQTMGDVIDIGMLRTTLMECGVWIEGDNYNGRIVSVSNGFLFREPLVNYSGHFPFLWDELVVPIRHGSDIESTQAVLTAAAQEVLEEYARDATGKWSEVVARYRIEDARVKPSIALKADENWLTFTLRYVVDYRNRRTTKDLLWRKILKGIDAADNITIAGASLTVEALPVTVTVANP